MVVVPVDPSMVGLGVRFNVAVAPSKNGRFTKDFSIRIPVMRNEPVPVPPALETRNPMFDVPVVVYTHEIFTHLPVSMAGAGEDWIPA
jgi:hypothetical protein